MEDNGSPGVPKVTEARRVYMAKWRRDNAAHLQTYYQENRALKLAQSAAYNRANPDNIRKSSLAYFNANAERQRSSNRKYIKENPIAAQARISRRRARKNGAGGSHTEAEVQGILIAQCGRCAACQKPMMGFHVDHVYPIFRGGSDNADNLQLLCPPCNLSKGTKTMTEWEAVK